MADKMAHDFNYGISQALIPYYSHVHKFGENASVGTSLESLWSETGLYVYPSSATVMTLSSDDANDAAAGTGAQKIMVEGEIADFVLASEEVTLNGTSGVNTSNSYLRINRLYNTDVGSGEVNDGNVYIGTGTITAGKPATVYGKIDAGKGQTLQAIYTVPAGYKAYLRRPYFSSGKGKDVQFDLFMRTDGEGFRIIHVGKTYESPYGNNFEVPIELPEKTDIEIRVISDAASTAVAGGFEVCLIEQ